MRTIVLVLEYDGTEFAGWQRQHGQRTVQGELERCVREMTQTELTVFGASRTDAGVHARGQVAHFQTESAIPIQGFRRGLNAQLPPSIAVRHAAEIDVPFHARFDSRGKHYRYSVWLDRERSPLLRHAAWHVPRTLDIARMQRVCGQLLGEHDFAAFRASGCSARTTQRNISAVRLNVSAGLLTIDVEGNAFLRNMVRIIAGTLVDLGLAALPEDCITRALHSGRREELGRTAPPQGLCLHEVRYGAEFTHLLVPPPRTV